ncbi:MAG: LamG domain-containing protein [Candidatus Poribacteria bacterium]|nr:LamG domain-containing protein [Candidatus Poribacteria bacterium]
MRYGLTICAASVFAVLMSMASAASALDSEGLIAAYPMNEGDGDEVKDISDNGYHGTLNGADWYKGADAPTGGFAVEFTGGQSHMAADNVFSSLPNNAISMGAWFYLTNHLDYEGILSGSEGGKGTPPGNCCQYRIMVNPDFLPFFDAGTHKDVAVHGFTVEEERWYHYVMTIGDDKVFIYMDGENIHENVPASDPLPELATPLLVGTGESAGRWPMTGYVDDVFVFDRVLSQEEVGEIMNEGLEGALSVSPKGKLASRWAALKLQAR